MSQFADDTTLLLDGTQNSLQAALNTIEIFGTYSGLKLNKEKTKVIWIGRKKHDKDKLVTTPMLKWGTTEFELLGIKYCVQLENMIAINFERYANTVQQIINHWNKRYLTPLGKITVIKTFIMSKYIHLFSSLPSPSKKYIQKLNTLLFNFLWDNKPDKLKRVQIIQEYSNGGLKMVDLDLFIKSLKITWIRRLIASDDKPWSTLFNSSITSISDILHFGSLKIKSIISNIKNPFWKDTLSCWIDLFECLTPRTLQDCYTSPIWYNKNISENLLFIPNWYNNGIRLVGDLYNKHGEMLTAQAIATKFGTRPIDFLTFHRLKTSIHNFINAQSDISYTQPTIAPNIPFHLKTVLKNRKGIKAIYNQLGQKNRKFFFNEKWNRDLDLENNSNLGVSSFQICFKTLKDNYLIWTQFKILNRIFGSNHLLYKMKISNTPLCRFCNNNNETILHILCHCPRVQTLWQNLLLWIQNILGFPLDLSDQTIILGSMIQDHNYTPINTILLVAKSYIVYCLNKNLHLDIIQLQNRIKNTFLEQKSISVINDSEAKFMSKWNPWLSLVNE